MEIDRDKIINSIRVASSEVFSTMLGLEAAAGEAFIEKSTPVENFGVLALIGLAGPWLGTGMLICSAELACQISSAMLMTEYNAVDGDVLDAMAEMSNMIFGNVKTLLEEDLGPLGLSIPTVIFGKNFATKSLTGMEWMVVPMQIGEHTMNLKFCLTPNAEYNQPTRHGFTRPYILQA
jgi:chemotaxis protein CheX